ncbi:regulator of chromosome condensation 1/beta-lactamase-inhibitor protein II, partial [Baffinella frigidus]
MACARVVSAGTAYYSCAVVYDNVDERGQLKCWGTGGPQLGLGDTDTRGDQLSDMGAALPAVDVGVGRFVVTVSNAATHTCAVLDNRRVKCWGDNSDWQLGYGDKYTRGHSSATMGEALPFVDIGTDYEAVDVCAAGVSPNWSYSCALSTAGSVKCWGSGHVISADTEIGSSWHLGTTPAEMGDNLPAINLGTSRYVTQLTCAKYDVCVILDNNQIKCWGQTSNFGGHQVAVMGDNLQIVSLGTGRTATQITCGGLHSCALLDNGDVKCWGRNNLGQLGLGDTADRGSVEANMGDNLPTVSLSSTLTTLAVYAGHEHTCALLSDHQLRCWGTNNEAVLGIGEDYWDTWNEIGDEPGEMGDALVAVDL